MSRTLSRYLNRVAEINYGDEERHEDEVQGNVPRVSQHVQTDQLYLDAQTIDSLYIMQDWLNRRIIPYMKRHWVPQLQALYRDAAAMTADKFMGATWFEFTRTADKAQVFIDVWHVKEGVVEDPVRVFHAEGPLAKTVQRELGRLLEGGLVPLDPNTGDPFTL